MGAPAAKITKTIPAVQSKTAGNSFFKKAGHETYFGNSTQSPFFSSSIQAKLSVSQPDDPQEKEADSVADKVMKMPEKIAPFALPDKKEELQQKEEKELQLKETPLINKVQCQEEPGEKLQPKSNGDTKNSREGDDNYQLASIEATNVSNTINNKNNSLYRSDILRQSGRGPPQTSIPFDHTLAFSKGGGSALPGDTQQFMESRFNADFSRVRIHTGTNAETMSRSVNAQAFAHGNDIYFNSGKFSPHSTEGRSLLAHELTHTIQQGGVVQRRVENAQQPLTKKRRSLASKDAQAGKDAHATKPPGGPGTPEAAIKDAKRRQPPAKKPQPASNRARAPARPQKPKPPSSKNKAPQLSPAARTKNKTAPQKTARALKAANAQEAKKASGTPINKPRAQNLKLSAADLRGNRDLPMPRATSPGSQLVLEAVRDKGAAGRQAFTTNVVQKTESLQNTLDGQLQLLTTTGASQEARLRGRFAATRASIIGYATSAKSQLSSHSAAQKGRLSAGQAAAMDGLTSAFVAGQEGVTNSSNTYADRAIETANNAATQFQANIQNAVQESNNIGNQKANAGDSDSEVREAKNEAAHTISSETAEKVTEGREEGVNFLRSTGPDTASEFRSQGAQAATQLMDGKGQADEQVLQVFTNAGTGIGEMTNQSNQALEQMKAQLLGQLSSLENSMLTQLNQQVAQKSSDFNTAGQKALNSIRQQSEQALAAGNQQLASVSQQIAGATVSEKQAQEGVAMAGQAISPAFSALNGKVNTSVQAIADKFIQKGGETASAFETAASSIAAQVSSFGAQSGSSVKQAQAQSTTALTEGATQAITGANGVVSQVATGVGQQVQGIDQSFGQALTGYQGSLQNEVGNGTTKVREPVGTLPGRIDEAQQRAAERASRSWLENQLHDAMEILSDPGFWAGLLVAIVLIAAVIFLEIVTLGTATIVIVAVAAAIGGISAAVGSMVGQAMGHSFSGGWDWDRVDWGQVGKAFLIGAVAGGAIAFAGVALGLSATTGLGALLAFGSVTSGVVGIITNLANGDPWDKGLLFNLTLGGLMSLFGAKVLPKAVGPRRIGPWNFPRRVPTAPVTPGPGPTPDQPGPTGPRPTPVPDQPEPTGPRPTPAPDQPEPPGPRPTPVPDEPEPPGPRPAPAPDEPEPPGPRPRPAPDQPEPPGPRPAPDQPEPPGPRPAPDQPEPPGPRPQPDEPEPPGPRPPGGGRRVPLDKIRYSQKTVKPTFEDGRTIDQVAGEMEANGWDFDRAQPNMVDWGDGEFQTVDHRRLVAARKANLQEVGANIHTPEEALPPSMSDRFQLNKGFTDPETGITYTKGQFAKTWGEAALFRSKNQGGSFPIRGTKTVPRISGSAPE